MRISDVKERHPKYSVPVGRSSNLVFTIWAVFGGFILHFLLSNYLTVLLKPSYEEPVETAADMVKRDIIPFYAPGGEMYLQLFAASEDPNYNELIIIIDFIFYSESHSQGPSSIIFVKTRRSILGSVKTDLRETWD